MTKLHYYLLEQTAIDWTFSIVEPLEVEDFQHNRAEILRAFADLVDFWFVKLHYDWIAEMTKEWRAELSERTFSC